MTEPCCSRPTCPCGSGLHPSWTCDGYGCKACAWSRAPLVRPLFREQYDQGELDEVVTLFPRSVVLERMDDDHFQLRIEKADGSFTFVELHVNEDRPLDGPQGPFLAGAVVHDL